MHHVNKTVDFATFFAQNAGVNCSLMPTLK